MLTASKSIQLWLESQIRPGNKDLLDRVIAGGTDLELQVNVSPLGGEPVDGKASTYINSVGDEWFSFRIPKGAATNAPHWTDYLLRYNLSKHVDAIGCTGWNWKKQTSQWVGFDFDSIVGHAAGVGISNAQLDLIRQAVSDLPYVEVRKSTGGLGLHLYVYLDNVPCMNHTEHAAIARCVLAKASEQVSMDLLQHVDACGGNMWVAARRATEENDGYGLIKPAECLFTQLPENWRDHVAVVNRSRPRVSIASGEVDEYDQLTAAYQRVSLDAEHEKVRERLGELGCAIWVQDQHLLQTHTKLLARVHEELKLRGDFVTNSRGSRLTDPNCFCFPMPSGAWKICRFGQGTAEHKSWNQDGRTTTCIYNEETKMEPEVQFKTDDFVRCLQSPGGKSLGWYGLTDYGAWVDKSRISIRSMLISHGCAKGEVDHEMGLSERNPWIRVSLPFSSEFPGNRQWNDGAQLRYEPASGAHPHWDMILDHVGGSLDCHLADDAWASENGIFTGRQYLQCWLAHVIRNPTEPLPYLFVCGPENSGKSIFHEAFVLLVTGGVVKADRALTSDFNGELEGCIVAVVEEQNVASNAEAHSRIKDAVTSPRISIRRMKTDTYEVINTTHWVQTANNADHCPLFSGDTRITALFVPLPRREIPKPTLLKKLEDEAAFFTGTLLNIELPASSGRLSLPVIETAFKRETAASNKSAVERYIDEYCIRTPEGELDYEVFYDAFSADEPGCCRAVMSKQLLKLGLSTTRLSVGKSAKKRVIKGLAYIDGGE